MASSNCQWWISGKGDLYMLKLDKKKLITVNSGKVLQAKTKSKSEIIVV
jgi:hypothetical protein